MHKLHKPKKEVCKPLFNLNVKHLNYIWWFGFISFFILSYLKDLRRFEILAFPFSIMIISTALKRKYFSALQSAFLFCSFYVVLDNFGLEIAINYSLITAGILILSGIIYMLIMNKTELKLLFDFIKLKLNLKK